MVGEGVLLTCLAQPDVAAVLSISRRPSGHAHPKLRELLVPDFFDLSAIEADLAGYSACFFCAGISSVGMSEADYTRTTHDLTLHVAQTLLQHSPNLTFCFVSGAGTDSYGTSRQMWARVKGRTENDLLRLFRSAYMFRPGFLRPVAGQQHILKLYRWLGWLYPVLRRLAPASACALGELGQAMLHAARQGAPKPVLEVKDIVQLAR